MNQERNFIKHALENFPLFQRHNELLFDKDLFEKLLKEMKLCNYPQGYVLSRYSK
jgi:hypothetical protein